MIQRTVNRMNRQFIAGIIVGSIITGAAILAILIGSEPTEPLTTTSIDSTTSEPLEADREDARRRIGIIAGP